MDCLDARSLIPSYLDGELSEAQAGPLRKHLLDCQACRAAAQGQKNQKRWFAGEPPVQVPKDFAARVARRAFAGDPGESWRESAALVAGPASAIAERRTLDFVLRLTAVAAAVLVGLSIAIGTLRVPSGMRLLADVAPETSVERALEELDRLNAAQASRSRLPDATPRGTPAPPPPSRQERRQ